MNDRECRLGLYPDGRLVYVEARERNRGYAREVQQPGTVELVRIAFLQSIEKSPLLVGRACGGSRLVLARLKSDDDRVARPQPRHSIGGLLAAGISDPLSHCAGKPLTRDRCRPSPAPRRYPRPAAAR